MFKRRFLEFGRHFWVVLYLRLSRTVVRRGDRWWRVVGIWVRMNPEGGAEEQTVAILQEIERGRFRESDLGKNDKKKMGFIKRGNDVV